MYNVYVFQNLFHQVTSMMESVTAVMVQMNGLKSVSALGWRVGITILTSALYDMHFV
jgi:aspartate/methionine/tyrosine aminotransferase